MRQANPSKETQIIDALIAENEGDVDAALRILRDVANADGRSSLFAMLWRARGNDAALAWFDEQPNRNEPAFLTAAGWSNLAICLARAERWEEAVSRLAAAEGSHDEWPDLAFVEGVLNAAMLLPLELRPYALEMNVFHPNIRTTEGKAADRYRDRARQCFAHAAESLAALDLVSREQAAKDWLLWLRLTDPDPETVDAARREIHEGMKIKERAIDLIPFADAFGIPFSESPIEHYLAQRARIGGLTGPEMFARLALARRTMATARFCAIPGTGRGGADRRPVSAGCVARSSGLHAVA